MSLKEHKIISFSKLLYHHFKPYRLRIFILTVLSFFSAILAGIGINAIIPLLTFITKQEIHSDDLITQTLKKLFLFFNIDFYIKNLLIFICLLFILKAVILFLCQFIKIKITEDYQESVRNDLFKRFINANWPYLLNQKLGHIEMVLIKNVESASAILSHIGSFIIIFVSLFIYLLVAVNISLYVSIVTMILSGIILLVLKPLINKVKKVAYAQEKINRDIAHHINENIIGMKTLKIMSVENSVISQSKVIFRRIKKMKMKAAMYKIFTGSIMQPVGLIFVCIIFVFAFRSKNFNLASFITIMYLVRQIFSYTETLQKNLLSFSFSIPYFKKIVEYRRDTKRNIELIEDMDSKKNNFEFNNSLKFNEVKFFYNSKNKVLDNISFSIKKGEMVGIIGPSGAGKTTIVDLILRLFEPLKGKILLDNQNIKKIKLSEWRQKIGYVSQDIFLKNDTILNNIQFYNDSISRKEIIEAAKKANIYNFINSLPDKFDTVIGERGILLSGGQRQRIIIARVLARKPEILILDEATSALDNESELKIQKIIAELKGKITVIIIAHRLSTVINSDRLIVIENGRIIEHDSPNNLLANKKSYFSRVYDLRE
ncbi:ABC transporter ATP-binding protein/permease [bacterium]|nr:ABC transporter ATP-binding protein/permease [bacterium]